jgi:Phosphodiester glycosidase
MVGLTGCSSPVSPAATALPTVPPTLDYHVDRLPTAVVHRLTIPAGDAFVITPIVSNRLATVEEFAQQTQAIAVINGGFFDPANQLSTSHILRQGQPIADPQQNDRLMQNPELSPYLTQILNRSEFRRYQCGSEQRYDITPHNAPPPTGCQLVDALGAGPRLLPESTLEAEGFWAQLPGSAVRDPLGRDQPNARSAVGIQKDGSVVWVMVGQERDRPGLSLPALADYLTRLGVEQALNLDGGSSASIVYKGQPHYGRLDATGKPVRRSVKSVLILKSR